MRNEDKIQKIIIIGIVLTSIILIVFFARFISSKNKPKQQADVLEDLESTSTQIGKTAEEANESLSEDSDFETAKLVDQNENTENGNSIENSISESKNEVQKDETKKISEEKNLNTSSKKESSTKEKEKITFSSPVTGNIIRNFAKDSLVYSDTLKEWITHKGIDIKADKTTVVSAAADGKIYAIKNDPRYGLTVIINHADGYQTVYSNLLTAEFVVKGEEVSQGQSIGTIGNTAAFEISDDYHLHFELLQNNEYLDPSIYIKFE